MSSLDSSESREMEPLHGEDGTQQETVQGEVVGIETMLRQAFPDLPIGLQEHLETSGFERWAVCEVTGGEDVRGWRDFGGKGKSIGENIVDARGAYDLALTVERHPAGVRAIVMRRPRGAEITNERWKEIADHLEREVQRYDVPLCRVPGEEMEQRGFSCCERSLLLSSGEPDPRVIVGLRTSITDGYAYAVTLEPDGQHMVVWRSTDRIHPYKMSRAARDKGGESDVVS